MHHGHSLHLQLLLEWQSRRWSARCWRHTAGQSAAEPPAAAAAAPAVAQAAAGTSAAAPAPAEPASSRSLLSCVGEVLRKTKLVGLHDARLRDGQLFRLTTALLMLIMARSSLQTEATIWQHLGVGTSGVAPKSGVNTRAAGRPGLCWHCRAQTPGFDS